MLYANLIITVALHVASCIVKCVGSHTMYMYYRNSHVQQREALPSYALYNYNSPDKSRYELIGRAAPTVAPAGPGHAPRAPRLFTRKKTEPDTRINGFPSQYYYADHYFT